MSTTRRVEENCSNVSDSLSTNNRQELKSDDKLFSKKSRTTLVLDQDSSEVHDRYSTSLYTVERGKIQ